VSGNSDAGDKSLGSLIEENVELYGYMSGFLKFRRHIYNIRWDMSRRDFRGRRISDARYLKVVPDYFASQTKRELLRYLLTLDKLEEERAANFSEMYYSGQVAQTPENLALTDVMFQLVQYSDIVAIDFQWSLSGDFANEASPAAKDWIEIHEMGYKYHIPDMPEAPRSPIPKSRWFNIQEELDNHPVASLFDLPHRNAEVDIEYSDLLSVGEGAGNEYIGLVRDHYYDLNDINPAEVARICLHRGYIQMSKSDRKLYNAIYERNQALRNIMKRERPMKENPFNGDDQLMTVHEYLREFSISDEEHNEILKDRERESIAKRPQFDIFGAESIIEVMDVSKTNRPTNRKSERVTQESVQIYVGQAKQTSMFI
jgi:hypothetical protein